MNITTYILLFTLLFFDINDPWLWEKTEVQKGGRIDAIAYFGDGVVILGTRNPNPGNVYRSEDYGKTWSHVGNITGQDYITCVASDERGTGYILTGKNVNVWKTTDYGKTWHDLGKVSNGLNDEGFANAYGMMVTDKGTVLVADANSKGGHIIRSTDEGKTWINMGMVSKRALYRLNKVGDGIIVNGWAGHIYKSKDEGKTWKDMGKISDSYLYAIEYLGNGEALIGTESGSVIKSTDNGESWETISAVEDAADDIAFINKNTVLYSTYTNNKKIFISHDGGNSWTSIGKTTTQASGDWFDHFITINNGNKKVVVGGTNKGYVLRKVIEMEN